MIKDIVTLCSAIKNCYGYALQRMTNDYYYNTGPDIHKKFFEYLYQQINFEPFLKRLDEQQVLIAKEEEAFISHCWEMHRVRITINLEYTRILGKRFSISEPMKVELNEIIKPLQITYSNLNEVTSRFTKTDNRSILGSNWKLKKIFSQWRTSQTVNPQFILKPEIVEDIINNYFLYIRFGGSIDE